jgi:biopolymer transport protein ExbD
MQFKARRELKRTRIEIIPMVDTMFFLLVFFMLSSLAMTKLQSIPVNLPKAATADRENALDFTVTIDSSLRGYINGAPVDLAQLGPTIQKMAGSGADLTKASVVINADTHVPYGVVVSCIDQARAVGVTHFPLATAAPGA